MKAIMVMFDSLNRHMLPPYGCDWVAAPNFARLAEHSVTFTNAFVGSMPCMPARRELHTGRYNFLHRSWGPLEPFDDSMPQLLKENGIYSHLVSDHYHYWEDGGATYHTRYSSWEISRGQEGDPWKGHVGDDVPVPESTLNRYGEPWRRQDWVNRHYMPAIEQQPQAKTFARGCEFIETNHGEDDWFLQIETFDPHEPYFSDQKYKDLYPHDYEGPHFDWPGYGKANHEREILEHLRYENAALISMCDEHLGKVLDLMDRYDLWRDTMLIVNTDHGFLLGEHEFLGKCQMPFYNEIAQTPLFIWDPRCGAQGRRCDQLVQTIDLAPTLLEYFGVERPADMQGAPLRNTMAEDEAVREAALFGLWGAQVNCTDGRHVYMRGPADEGNQPLCEYTLMPTHMRGLFAPEELQTIHMHEPFSFTKGVPVMQIPARQDWVRLDWLGTALYDCQSDPGQLRTIQDETIENRMAGHMIRLMRENDAPVEQFERLGLLERV